MYSTFVIATTLLGLIIVDVTLWAVCLRIGLRWAKVADVTKRRVVVATATVFAIRLSLFAVCRLVTPISNGQTLFLGVLEFGGGLLIPSLVITRVFKVTFLRSLQAWLPTLVATIGMLLVVLLVMRPFVCEVFVSPSNAMAPTLLGNTWRSTCPKCHEFNVCSPSNPQYAPSDSLRMICRNFHVHQVSDFPQKAFPPDRFIVAKFLAPKRWDVVVFQYPENPSTLYVMRLVGLPGESITIKNGAVWADGVQLEVPDTLRGVEYLSELPEWNEALWGSEQSPATLGPDEYFVLGDFSAQSNDSRIWQRAAPGHQPFAVPESHLRGVVTHIYWPPERWRILR